MVLKELQHALRNLRRAPRFSLACIFTLALALTGTVTLLNLLEAFVFRPLAVTAPEQLIGIYPLRGEVSAGVCPQGLQASHALHDVSTRMCGAAARAAA